MIDLLNIVAACEFDGTENSVKDFLPEGEYTIDEVNQQLKIKVNKNQSDVAQPGWYVIKDSLNSFTVIEPEIYALKYEHMLSKD